MSADRSFNESSFNKSNQLVSKHYDVGGTKAASFGRYTDDIDRANERWRNGYQPPPKNRWLDTDGELRCLKPASVTVTVSQAQWLSDSALLSQTPLYVFQHQGEWLAQDHNEARKLYQGRTVASTGQKPTLTTTPM